MPWCSHCQRITEHEKEPSCIYVSCTRCGKVDETEVYSDAPNFNADGRPDGVNVKYPDNEKPSRNKTLDKGRKEIQYLVERLGVGGGNSIVDQASIFYKIAVERKFTTGRRTNLVAAACLYIACRENKKAFLLIDFSEEYRINVYELGAVFLELCKLLRLEEHPIVQKSVDPSLFIHRFTERLLGGKNIDDFADVSRTALRIVASMKRDWMQTGRKPSGLCGAALYISALSYGLKFSKSDVVRVVHICEATLTKRLIEFENTDSGSLTIEEFNVKASKIEKENQFTAVGTKSCGTMELLCEHKGSKVPHYAHGLCEGCYGDFITLSGGLMGGSDPPAFQRAEQERMAKASDEENAEERILIDKELEAFSSPNQDSVENAKLNSKESVTIDTASDQSHEYEDMDNVAGDESETLSDIDDAEVDGYLHNEEESRCKKKIWEIMNREYIEEQAEKEAVAAAEKKALEASYQNCSPEMQEALKLAAAAAAAGAKTRKERQQKRAAEAKNAAPAQTAAEATCQMLAKKRLSSRINYDVLEKLFDDPLNSAKKKGRVESDSGVQPIKGNKEVESNLIYNEDYMGQGDEYAEEIYGDDSYYENGYEGYGKDEGYGNDEDYLY
ncbi:hypothetical protein GIB67_026844 [Kingdonia uniflora]|uniref:Cyclin-like domain-containing protein n=1 Tax=Kingdonia uniflora TaxID=39325 RepID=A0A7J7M7S9_9MAGN|nr:hypothetical protein GIB67_026844 [Kingdonia uniflora]